MCHLGHFAALLSWHWLCSTDESFAVEQPLVSVCMGLTGVIQVVDDNVCDPP